jgi:iron complex transport system substrate-binding protein
VTTDARARAPRVVSLLPAATEIVAALGAIEQLVGVTHECDHPSSAMRLPRVTGSAIDRDASSAAIDADVRALTSAGAPVFTLDAALVASLVPQVLLTQSVCEVCALPESEVDRAVAALAVAPTVVSLGGTTLAGVWDDVRRVGDAIGRRAEAEALIAASAARMRRVHDTLKAAAAPRPRVVVIEWVSPLFVAGHWTPELVRRAGGIDVLAEPGAHSVQVDVDAVRAADPEVLLFAPCGFDVDRAAHEADALLETDEWRWARDRTAWALDGNSLTSRPGPRLVDAIEVMAAIFAPDLFEKPIDTYAIEVRRHAEDASTVAGTLLRRDPDPHRHQNEEHGEHALGHHGIELLHGDGAEIGTDEDPQRDQQRGAHVEVAVLVVLPRAERADGKEERTQRGAGGRGRLHPAGEHQGGHDDDPATDPEQS